jgi:hypothetical protein
MDRFIATAALAILASAGSTVFAGTPNTTPAGAVSYEVGQGWVSAYYDETTPDRWYSYAEIGSRSYCIEAVQSSVSPIPLDPKVYAYTDPTGAAYLVVNGLQVANDNGGGDPYFVKGARACYIAPAGGVVVRGLKVSAPLAAGSGDSGFVKFRVVETTLTASPWFIVMGAYGVYTQGYLQLRNRTSTDINVTVTSSGVWTSRGDSQGITTRPFAVTVRPDSGNPLRTVNITSLLVLPANWVSTFPNPNDTSSFPTVWGNLNIAHDGPPGSLQGYIDGLRFYQLNSPQ